MDASARTTKSANTPCAAGARGVFRVGFRPGQPPGHVVMFWVLTGMAVTIFAPCVLVPVWIEAEEVRAYERSLAGVIGGLEAQITENDARTEALRADPLVNDRISRRELNHRSNGERITAFSPEELKSLPLRMSESAGVETEQQNQTAPGWALAVQRWLPDWPWRKLFAESPNRTVMLLMAAGLLLSAFFLYGHSIHDRLHSSA